MYRVSSASRCISGVVTPPADKSISHRSLIFAALATGRSSIRNLLRGEDVLRTLNVLQNLGVSIIDDGEVVRVDGRGIHAFKAPQSVLDCGNSGTTMRLMMGLLSGQPFVSRLTGDASLNRRPMGRVTAPLLQMGATITSENSLLGRLMVVSGRCPLSAIVYDSPVASAQVKSAVLLAGLYADRPVSVSEPHLSRDHSERFLQSMGADLVRAGNRVTLSPGKGLSPFDLIVPSDPSSAAFFIVASLLVPESQLVVKDICLNPTRIAFLHVLKRMGANLEIREEKTLAGESVGCVTVKYSPLVATDILPEEVPWLIDEIPILSIALARARGTSRVTGAEELRVKESDRITQMARVLDVLGVTYVEAPDGITIVGSADWRGGVVDSHGDHRIAMSAAVSGLLCREGLTVTNTACVATSFPNFDDHLRALGVSIEVKKTGPE